MPRYSGDSRNVADDMVRAWFDASKSSSDSQVDKKSKREELAYLNLISKTLSGETARQKAVQIAQENFQTALLNTDAENYKEQIKTAKQQLDQAKRSANIEQVANEKLAGLLDGFQAIRSEIDKAMDHYVETQASMNYGLVGVQDGLETIRTHLQKALTTNGLVKQEEVYNNLQKLVKEGIIYNVEQRAFLSTLSDELEASFDTQSKELYRLINLQNKDLTSNRAAIQSSLQEFLNQNYQTSQYIKDGFAEVSHSLLQAQSLMVSTEAMELEKTVQTWLGSLQSAGLSSATVSSLAEAMGYLGSGNISQLSGSSMQNLLVMGASRAGLSYADLLNGGVNSQQANAIMKGMTDYIASMGVNASNVVKSEYARIFGIDVADIVAASQVGADDLYEEMTKGTTGVSDSISNLLDKLREIIPATQRFSNTLQNMKYTIATEYGSELGGYMAYKIGSMATDIASSVFNGTTANINPFGVGVSLDIGKLISAAGTTALLGDGLMSAFGSAGGFNLRNDVSSLFNSLAGGSVLDRQIQLKGSTSFSRTSGQGTSGLIMVNTNTGDYAEQSKNQAQDKQTKTQGEQEAASTTDIKTVLEGIKETLADFPATIFGVQAGIKSDENTVRIDDTFTTYLSDILTMQAMNIQNIYMLLAARFTGTQAQLINTATNQWSHSFDWVDNTKDVQTSLSTGIGV